MGYFFFGLETTFTCWLLSCTVVMKSSEFCSWKTAEQNLAVSHCKSLQEPVLSKHDWRFEGYELQRVIHFPAPLLLHSSWSLIFFLSFSVTRESSAKTPLLICAENRMIVLGLIYSGIEWSQLSVPLGAPDAQYFCGPSHYLIFIESCTL